jgi:serine/threonine protein kinase
MSVASQIKEIFVHEKRDDLEHMLGWELWDYKFLGEIYSGSVSTVCRALTPDDRIVAIKFLKVDQVNVRGARKHFRREAYLTAQWNHERLVRVLDYFPEVHQPAIVLEYFDDRNLKQRILHKEEVIKVNCLRIMREALEGLRFIHDSGYIHLDIKPENILVNNEGESRLIDFTLAERIGEFRLGVRKIAGTRSYIAPETIRRKNPVPGTDLYSLACAFYEMLTFKNVFVAETPNSLLKKHLKEKPSSLRSNINDVHPLLDDLIMQMLEKQPSNRPDDCTECLEKLNNVPSITITNG